MDITTPERRSRIMSNIRGKNTKPELVVRKLVHGLGYRFRLHRRDLPGSPDLVLPRLRKIIFVHGCFWHRHQGCKFAYTPKSNTEFWLAKLNANVTRDAAAQEALATRGWNVLVVWECEIADLAGLSRKVRTFLTQRPTPSSPQEPLMRQEEKYV
jgi:DNA mismatch endonuclease, patch repair protein